MTGSGLDTDFTQPCDALPQVFPIGLQERFKLFRRAIFPTGMPNFSADGGLHARVKRANILR
jgi:hypothetical protein